MERLTKIGWISLAIIVLIIAFYTGRHYKPTERIITQFDSITYKSKLDSLNVIIQRKHDSLNVTIKAKEVIRTKYQKIYLNLDSTTFDEILWEHGLLDDTLVRVPETDIVKFRLVQGAEARATNTLEGIEIKQLKSIISGMEEIRQNDSTTIAFLVQDNYKLNQAYLMTASELTALKLRLDQMEGKNRSNRFKIAAIGLCSFIGGIFVGILI